MIWRSPYRKIIYGVKFGTEVWTQLKNGVYVIIYKCQAVWTRWTVTDCNILATDEAITNIRNNSCPSKPKYCSPHYDRKEFLKLRDFGERSSFCKVPSKTRMFYKNTNYNYKKTLRNLKFSLVHQIHGKMDIMHFD